MNIEHINTLIDLALNEDIDQRGDQTSNAIFDSASIASAVYRNRKPGVISGLFLVELIYQKLGISDFSSLVKDGDHLPANCDLFQVTGDTKKILLAERTSLNFLSHLSGISTLTAKWCDAISNTKAQIRDTRKTTPGFRELEKYAVQIGGALNHRMNLSTQALIKDNHIAHCGSITLAVEKIRKHNPNLPIEIEVDNFEQLSEAISLKPNIILLDNFSPSECESAVALSHVGIKFEASGGITFENLMQYAQSGVDYIAIGAITHSAPALDIGLDFI